MSFFGKLFGSEKAITKAADGLYNGLDKIFYTDEEKADQRNKILLWINNYMAATTGQNLARRFIAIVVTLLWCLLIVAGVVLHIAGFTNQADYVFTILTDAVLQPFSIIIGFYFLAHAIAKRSNQ